MNLGDVQLTNEKKAEVMAQVKQQIAFAHLQETIQVILKSTMSCKTSVVWDYFTRQEDNVARCNLCSQQLKLFLGTTSQLCRHLRQKHPDICLKPKKRTMHHKLKRSVVWDYFTRQEDNMVRCNLCTQKLKLFLSTTSYLIRHLRAKHPDISLTPRRGSLRAQSSAVYKEEIIEEEIIGEEIIGEEMIGEEIIGEEIIEGEVIEVEDYNADPPPDICLKPKRRTMHHKLKRSVVWDYFTRQEDNMVRCNLCTQKLKLFWGTTSCLIRHLRTKHPDISLTPRRGSLRAQSSAVYKEEIIEGEIIGEEIIEGEVIEAEDHNADPPPDICLKPKRHTMHHKLKRSVVWDYFTRQEDNMIRCNLCTQKLKLFLSTTSYLIRHLRAKHPDISLMPRRGSLRAQSSAAAKEKADNLDPPPPEQGFKLGTPRSSTSQVIQVQDTIKQFLVKPKTVPKRQELDNQLIKMIVKELHPFSIVEGTEFKHLVHLLNPSYPVPACKTLSNSLLLAVYNEVYENVRADVGKAKFVALTIDHWTNIKTKSYMAVTAHFVDGGELKTYLLECSKIHVDHTAENIQIEISRVLDEWGLQGKVQAISTDNAYNMVSAIHLGNWKHIQCFAHTLNLILQASIEEIDTTRSKVKQMVEHFCLSTEATENLNHFQKQLGFNPPKVLIQDDTRWNSTFYMMQRILELKLPLSSSMAQLNFEECLDENDWKIITETCKILQYFEEITREVSSKKNVTISKIILYIQSMKDIINENSRTQTIPEVKKFLEKLNNKINGSCILQCERDPLYMESTLLDPRFKDHGFQNMSYFQEAKKSIISKGNDLMRQQIYQEIEAAALAPLPSTSPSHQHGEHPITVLETNSIWKKFDSKIKKETQRLDDSLISLEVDRFLTEPLLCRTEDPLEWWFKYKNVYPILFQIVTQIFCIQATSVPSERIFSKAGQVFTERRNRLGSSKVNEILFLNVNWN